MDEYVSKRTFRRFWILMAVGYAILAIGAAISLAVLADQVRTNRDQGERLETGNRVLAYAAGAYCVAGLRLDPGENTVIHRFALGDRVPLPPDCKLIVGQILRAGD